MKQPRIGGVGPDASADMLPDPILETIFQNATAGSHKSGDAPLPPSQTIPLVSKRWHRVWNTSQLLWSTLNLDLAVLQRRLQGLAAGERDAALAALVHLLRLRGKGCRRLWLHSDAPTHLPIPQLLALISPNLQQVFVGQLSSCRDTLDLLQRFATLRSLDLPAAAYHHLDWAASPHLLTGFAGLQELTLRDGGISDGLLGVVGSLRGLRLLSVSTPDALPPRFHAQVGRLSVLEELDLYFTPTSPHQHFEFLPAGLRGLKRLCSLYILAPHSLSECLLIGPGLADLPALQDLQIRCRTERLPADLWVCAHLTRLDLELKQQHSAGSVAPPTSMDMPGLRDLRLAKCRFPNSTLPAAFCQLTGLTRLAVTHSGLKSEEGAPGLPHQFSSLSGLVSLSLEGNGLTSVPCGLTGLSALRALDLSCNSLSTLPPGPYLDRLELVSLANNRLSRVPAALSCARACEVVDLTQNPALELCRHDADAVLLRMPRLGLLLLGKWPGCTAAMDWRTDSVAALVWLAQQRPQLEVDFEHTAAEYENLPLG